MTWIDPAVLTSDEIAAAVAKQVYEWTGAELPWEELPTHVRENLALNERSSLRAAAALASQGRPVARECGDTNPAAGGPCRRPAGHRGIHEHTTEHGFSLWPQEAIEGSGGDDTGEVERLRALCGEAARHLRTLPAQSEVADGRMAERLEAAAAGLTTTRPRGHGYDSPCLATAVGDGIGIAPLGHVCERCCPPTQEGTRA